MILALQYDPGREGCRSTMAISGLPRTQKVCQKSVRRNRGNRGKGQWGSIDAQTQQSGECVVKKPKDERTPRHTPEHVSSERAAQGSKQLCGTIMIFCP